MCYTIIVPRGKGPRKTEAESRARDVHSVAQREVTATLRAGVHWQELNANFGKKIKKVLTSRFKCAIIRPSRGEQKTAPPIEATGPAPNKQESEAMPNVL